MAIEVKSGASSDVLTVDATSKAARVTLYDADGDQFGRARGQVYAPGSDRFLPVGGFNDGTFRMARVDRMGGFASAKYTPIINYQLYTAALMPGWQAPATTFTVSHALASGTFLNAAGTGAVSSTASLISIRSMPKLQKSPMFMRVRARLIKGATNGQADIGFSSTNAPAAAVLPNGFVFLYGSDGTLKPTVYMNSAVIAQGTDFASSVDSAKYHVWSVIVDDDAVTFICQDPTTGTILNEQTLQINALDPRFGLNVFWYAHNRCFVTSAAANVGAPTQLYVADIACGYLDLDAGKPWGSVMAGMHMGSVVNPTVAATQLANYANTAAPASATLSNTVPGYTTLGGQWQFAAVGGAETDYALFGFTVPTGVSLYVDSVRIDTWNTGAAVATTETLLQWFMGEAAAATLATNSFRRTLGLQSLPIGAAIGAQAQTIDRMLNTPFVVHGGRVFHIGLKMPRGTATASQIIRGIVDIGGYFE